MKHIPLGIQALKLTTLMITKILDESNMGNLDDKSNTNEGLLEKNGDDYVDDYDENY